MQLTRSEELRGRYRVRLLDASEAGEADAVHARILQISAKHTDTGVRKKRSSSRARQEDEMPPPAMRVAPLTVSNCNPTSNNSSSSPTRDMLHQRQATVNANMAPVTLSISSTQQSSASSSAVGSDQPLREPLEQYRSKELRKEVSRLKLKVNRQGGAEGNDHKRGYIALIREHQRGTGKLSAHVHSAANVMMNTARNNQNRRTDKGGLHGDPTFKLLDALFSEQIWRKFYNLHHTIAQRNRSMLSHTMTIPSIDMYSPMQSTESLRFWEELAGGLREYFSAGGSSFSSCTPAKLFSAWRELCAAYNGKAKERMADPTLINQLAYLNQLLEHRPALASLVSVGSFHSTFAPTVAAEAPQIIPEAVNIPDEDDDDLAVITDDDDVENGISQDTAAQPSTSSLDRSAAGPPQQQLEIGAVADQDSEVVSLQREFWRSKKELVLQSIANAKLQFSVLQTRFMEEQLCGSKRKIQVLQEELRRVDQSSYAAKEINEELSFYVREKRRVLDSLIRTGSNDKR